MRQPISLQIYTLQLIQLGEVYMSDFCETISAQISVRKYLLTCLCNTQQYALTSCF